MSFRECKEVGDWDSAAYDLVCALTRSAKLLSAHAHSQQNQQPVDIWQSALRRANEGYSETEQEWTRTWRAREFDAKGGGAKGVWGDAREGGEHFEARYLGSRVYRRYRWKRYGCMHLQDFLRLRISGSIRVVLCCDARHARLSERRPEFILARISPFRVETVARGHVFMTFVWPSLTPSSLVKATAITMDISISKLTYIMTL